MLICFFPHLPYIVDKYGPGSSTAKLAKHREDTPGPAPTVRRLEATRPGRQAQPPMLRGLSGVKRMRGFNKAFMSFWDDLIPRQAEPQDVPVIRTRSGWSDCTLVE